MPEHDPQARKALILTVGLPRSGKTTWCQENLDIPVVCPDELRQIIAGDRNDLSKDGRVWAAAHVMVEALFSAGHQYVILDATNMKRRYRDAWQNMMWTVLFKVFDTPVETCLERVIDNLALAEAIRRMHEAAEPLEEDELRKVIDQI